MPVPCDRARGAGRDLPPGCHDTPRLTAFAVPVTRIDAPAAFEVRGRLTALDDAAGRYALGSEFGLLTPPGSPLHPHLRQLVGRRVRVRVEPT